MTGELQRGARVTGRDATHAGAPNRSAARLRRQREQEGIERGPAGGRGQHGQDHKLPSSGRTVVCDVAEECVIFRGET